MKYVYLLVEHDPVYNLRHNVGCYTDPKLARKEMDERTERNKTGYPEDRGLYYVIETLPLDKESA